MALGHLGSLGNVIKHLGGFFLELFLFCNRFVARGD
jgi:hypothetical protein